MNITELPIYEMEIIPLTEKEKNQEIHYGTNGGFTIWIGGGRCQDGHFMGNHYYDNKERGELLVEYITKVCKQHHVSIVDTIQQIDNNLRINDVKYKKL